MAMTMRTAPTILNSAKNAKGTKYTNPEKYANPPRIAMIALSQYKTARIVMPEGRTPIRGTRSEGAAAMIGLSCIPQFQQKVALASISFPHLKQ
jgi:hypothetical protein